MNAMLLLVISLINVSFIQTCIVYGTEQLEESLCKSKSCPFYAKCKLDEHSFVAKCVCPEECDELLITNEMASIRAAASSQLFMIGASSNTNTNSGGDEDEAARNQQLVSMKSKEEIMSSLFGKTVCGSDGIDYESFCELKKESCRSSRDIKIFYFGKCSKYLF